MQKYYERPTLPKPKINTAGQTSASAVPRLVRYATPTATVLCRMAANMIDVKKNIIIVATTMDLVMPNPRVLLSCVTMAVRRRMSSVYYRYQKCAIKRLKCLHRPERQEAYWG